MTIAEDMVASVILSHTYRDGMVLITLSSVSARGNILVVSEAKTEFDGQKIVLDYPLYYVNPPSSVDGIDNIRLVMERMIADTVRESVVR